MYSSRRWDYAFRKLEFNTKCYTYLNELPFKHYMSNLGGVGVLGHAYFDYLGGGGGGPEFGKTCLYNT